MRTPMVMVEDIRAASGGEAGLPLFEQVCEDVRRLVWARADDRPLTPSARAECGGRAQGSSRGSCRGGSPNGLERHGVGGDGKGTASAKTVERVRARPPTVGTSFSSLMTSVRETAARARSQARAAVASLSSWRDARTGAAWSQTSPSAKPTTKPSFPRVRAKGKIAMGSLPSARETAMIIGSASLRRWPQRTMSVSSRSAGRRWSSPRAPAFAMRSPGAQDDRRRSRVADRHRRCAAHDLVNDPSDNRFGHYRHPHYSKHDAWDAVSEIRLIAVSGRLRFGISGYLVTQVHFLIGMKHGVAPLPKAGYRCARPHPSPVSDRTGPDQRPGRFA